MLFAFKSILFVTDTSKISGGFACYLRKFRRKEMIPEGSKMGGMLTEVERKHLDKQRILMMKILILMLYRELSKIRYRLCSKLNMLVEFV